MGKTRKWLCIPRERLWKDLKLHLGWSLAQRQLTTTKKGKNQWMKMNKKQLTLGEGRSSYLQSYHSIRFKCRISIKNHKAYRKTVKYGPFKEKTTETLLRDDPDKDFKTTVKDAQNYRMIWKKEVKKTLYKQNGTINKEWENKKIKKHSRAENYNCNEKFTRGILKANLSRQKKEPVKLKIGQWKLSSLRNRKKDRRKVNSA